MCSVPLTPPVTSACHWLFKGSESGDGKDEQELQESLSPDTTLSQRHLLLPDVTGLLAGWGIWRTLGKAVRRPAGNNCWVFATEPERER